MTALFERMMEGCTLYERRRVSDGEGGFATVWAPGAAFEAAVTHDRSAEERVAERQGLASEWTVTTRAELGFHDVFVRDSDRQALRVTSKAGDGKAPACASFAFNQCTAEAYEMEADQDGD